MTYPKPATPLPWRTVWDLDCVADADYIVRTGNAFPHLVEALEHLKTAHPLDAPKIISDALAIASGEVTP